MDFSALGHEPEILLPAVKARTEDRQRIVDALSGGLLVTHFIGHGGRFIWRTGPPDLADQVDLFGLEQVEQLTPTSQLPIVMSVSCYSAPFDHPSAHSIGEAFLSAPDRGAIAFIGASWRNAPPLKLSERLVWHASRPGTIGEALLRAQRQVATKDAIHLFNLLGDPAVPIHAPQEQIEWIGKSSDADSLAMRVPQAAVGGTVSIRWLDGEGAAVGSAEIKIEAPEVTVSRPRSGEEQVIAYFWNEITEIDGMGALMLPGPVDPQGSSEASHEAAANGAAGSP